jgi:6-phosphogluconolactonase/glucosamine-6-phosphate isomerase/deaminase
MTSNYFPTTQEAKTAGINRLNEIFYEHKNDEVLFLSSGGSSLQLLDGIDTELIGEKTTITVLDDRFSTDPKINNFDQLLATNFAARVKEKNANFFDTRPLEHETLAECATRFAHHLKDWRKAHLDGIIIATVGFGPDGHVSGILPFPEDPEYFSQTFDNPDRWVAGYDVGTKSPYRERITVTLPFLQKQLDYAVTYAVGQVKTDALQRIFSSHKNSAETPAQILLAMKAQVDLFTDIPLDKRH